MRKLSIHEFVLIGFVLWIVSYAYLYTYQFTDIKPLYTYFVLIGFAIFRVLYAHNFMMIKGRWAQHLLIWLLFYGVYICFSWLMSSRSDTATQLLITWMEVALILGSFLILFSNSKRIDLIQAAFVFIAIVGVVINIYDFLFPTFSSVPGRAAGFYENPNIAGKFIAMSMVAGIGVVPSRMRLWFVAFCGIGVLLTFSRSSWLLWLIGFMSLVYIGVIGPTRYRKIAIIMIAIIMGIITALFLSGKLGELTVNSPLQNYLDSNTSARLGVGVSHFDDDAANERKAVAKEALVQGAKAPLFGNGLGFTHEPGDGWTSQVSTHNMYLLFWAEGGIVGLALYLWLMILLVYFSSGIGRVIALQFVLAGFFSHNLLEQPAALALLVFALALAPRLYRRTIYESQPLQTAVRV